MKKFHIETSDYDSRNHRSDRPDIYAGFALLAILMTGLFLL